MIGRIASSTLYTRTCAPFYIYIYIIYIIYIYIYIYVLGGGVHVISRISVVWLLKGKKECRLVEPVGSLG